MAVMQLSRAIGCQKASTVSSKHAYRQIVHAHRLGSEKVSRQRCSIVAGAVASRPSLTKKDEKLANEKEELEDEDEEEEFEDPDSPDDPSALSTQQVQNLMNVICQETEIAEVQLLMGSFGLKLRRKLDLPTTVSSYAPTQQASPGVPAIEQPFQSTSSMDESQIASQPSDNGHMSSTDEDDHDENLIFLGAPKVGVLRRHRYVKGKKVGKAPLIEVGAKVKKGQLLAFIEQLGTHVPIEAPQAGEIVSIECQEGSAVEYKEVIIEMAPFFGGHIIGDRKYA